MPGYGNDVEVMQNIMKNYTQVTMIFDKQIKKEEEKLSEFLEQMNDVFEFIESLNYNNAHQMFTTHFSPSMLANSIELVADAEEIELKVLRLYRSFLLNRLNSYTKNRKLLFDILTRYYMQFLNCYEDHARNNIYIQRKMIFSALGMQTNASDSFVNFIQGPLASALRQEEKMMGKEINSDNWKKNAI